MKYGLLVPMVLTFCLTGCGGGNSGGGSALGPVPVAAPPAPPVEMLRTSTELGGAYDMPYQMIADSPDGSLYVTTPYALLQVNKATGSVRTLAGFNQDIYSPTSVYLSGQYLYGGDNSGRIFGISTGTDGFSGIDLLYNGHLPGTLNTGRIFGGGSALYYMADDGVHAMPFGDYQNATLVTPYPAATATIAVTQNEIFFSTYTMSVFRFDLRSKQMQLVKSGIQNQTGNGAESPVMAWHAPYLYWVDGTNLDRYNTTTAQVERVATALPRYVYMLAADDTTVYANATYSSDGSPAMLDKVDVTSGQVSQITPSSQIQAIAAGNGVAFYVSGSDIYQVNGDAPPQRILSAAEYNVPWVQRDGLAYDHGMLFMNSGEKILVHELATSKTTVYFPNNRPDSYFYHDAALYLYTYNGSGALTRIPLDKPLRRVVEYSPSITTPGSVKSLVGDDTNLYWLYKGQYDGLYKVMRVAKSSPGAVEELFRSSSELRDLTMHGGKLHFSCLDSCGRSGWVLASVAPNGGPVTAEVPLADAPRSFYLNGRFYVADTADHHTRSLYLIDVERAAAKLLLRDLPYSSDSANDVTVRASSRWLYLGSWWGGRKISRYPILSGGTLGSEELIVGRRDDDLQSLMPTSISTDGSYLYFWNGGLKRVAE